MRIFSGASLIAAVAGLALAQTTPATPAFDAGDVRVSPRSANPFPRGGYYPAGAPYELHQETMADLIRTAWGLDDNNRVIGGPAWLDDTRFDVLAQAPEATSPQTAKLMLRTLIEDRRQLAVHEETRPTLAYVLLNGRHAPLLREANHEANEAGSGQCQNRPVSNSVGSSAARSISCRNVTMDAFAKALHGLANGYLGHIPTVDLTGLKGSWVSIWNGLIASSRLAALASPCSMGGSLFLRRSTRSWD